FQTPQQQLELTKLLKDVATSDPRFRLNEGGTSLSAQIFFVTNSHGTSQLARETQLSWSLMGMATEGERLTSFDYYSEILRKAAGAKERIHATTEAFRNRMIENLTQGEAKSYKGVVVFSPRAVSDILLHSVVNHLNGRSLVEGTSRWKLEQKGERV